MQEAQDNTTPPSPSNEQRLENFLGRMEFPPAEGDRVRTLLRLIVGAAVIGWDELLLHLEQWEEEVRAASNAKSAGPSRAGTIVFVEPGTSEVPPMSQVQELRYLLLGMLFETESRLRRRGRRAYKAAGQTASFFFKPLTRWVNRSQRFDPTRARFDELVKRGERLTDQWIRLGLQEESHSRKLVLTATQDTFNASMEQLGQAPELQNLVKVQSAGLSREVLDEVRSRTVSGDYMAEGLVRRIFRRTPRQSLPSPAEAPSEDEISSQ